MLIWLALGSILTAVAGRRLRDRLRTAELTDRALAQNINKLIAGHTQLQDRLDLLPAATFKDLTKVANDVRKLQVAATTNAQDLERLAASVDRLAKLLEDRDRTMAALSKSSPSKN